MNYSSKSLIFFSILMWMLLLSASATNAVNESTLKPIRLPLKKATLQKAPPVTGSAIGVRFTWQTIHSLGQGAKISTAAETFSADGEIVNVRVNSWVLRISGTEVPVSVNMGQRGTDGVLFVDRYDLLKVLGVSLNSDQSGFENDINSLRERGGSLQLALFRTPNRYMETVYTSPDDDLFIVKVSAILIASR